jgi:hypothetical protein
MSGDITYNTAGVIYGDTTIGSIWTDVTITAGADGILFTVGEEKCINHEFYKKYKFL